MKFEFEYDGRKYEVEILQGSRLVYYYPGKTYPKITQCTLKSNGMLLGTGEVIKHHKDKDNYSYSCRASLKKALQRHRSHGIWREFRTKLYSILNETIETMEQDLKELHELKSEKWWSNMRVKERLYIISIFDDSLDINTMDKEDILSLYKKEFNIS